MKTYQLFAAILCALSPSAFAASDALPIGSASETSQIEQTLIPSSSPATTNTMGDEIKKSSASVMPTTVPAAVNTENPPTKELTQASKFNTDLDEIVVTATRIEQPLKQTLSSTTVITQEDIKNSQAADVPTILRSVAGIEISQTGGYGKSSSIFMRGSESKQVLVLLDGVRINSATLGTTAVENLMLDQIERIEIVRGNVSSLYGSEAIGGVIQIFTKRGHGEPAFNFSAGAGNQGTQRAAAGFGGKIDNTNFNLQLSRFRTDGISAINPAIANNVNPDNDGYDNTSLSANLRHAFNPEHSLSATLFNSEGRNQYDVSGVSTDIHEGASLLNKLSLSSENRLADNWQSKLQFAQGSDESKVYQNAVFSSSIKTVNRQASWENTLALSTWGKLLLGAENLNQKVTVQTAFAKTERNVNSVLAGFTGNYDSHQLQLNARQDSYSDFGKVNTGLLGYGYAISETWRATTNYSTAFRAPTFNELYFPNYGNPDIRPEHSRNMEAGIHYATTSQSLDLTYFDNRTQDLINSVTIAPGTYQAQNTKEARIDGLELSYAGQFGDTNIKTAVTIQNPRDISANKQLIRRSTTHSSVAATHKMGNLQVGAEWLYSYIRPDFSNTLPEYHVFNLTSAYTLSKQFKLSMRADNITDQNDSNVYGYNPLGRTFFASVSYQQ